MIYCDYNATAPLRPEARKAMILAMEMGANPSSVHTAGRNARRAVEQARQHLGGAIGSRSEDIVFTSGGTEANALAIQGATALISDPVILYSDLEHPAVRAAIEASGKPVVKLGVRTSGEIDLEDLAARLTELDGRTPFLTLMLANNETGVIQPVAEAAALVRNAGGYVHCDAVQALGKISVNAALLGVDYLAFSAHKFGGPLGVGALWFRPRAPLKPVQLGGGQERSFRSGTENVPAIAGFGAAIEAVANLPVLERTEDIRNRFETLILAQAPVTIFGKDAKRLPGTSNFALEGFKGETQVMVMDLGGVAISSGSACSSGKVKQSDVLAAMGFENRLPASAIRVSFGWASTLSDAEKAAEVWLTAARRAVPDAFKESA